MRLTLPCSFRTSHLRLRPEGSSVPRPPLIRIKDGTFHRRQPLPVSTEAEKNPGNNTLYSGLDYSFPAVNVKREYWSIVGPSNAGKTTFLEILQGQHLCFPATARSYPYLSSAELLAKDRRLSWPARAIQYVGFNDKQKGLSGLGTYMSARYESRRETTDFSLQDYLLGKTQSNVEDDLQEKVDEALLNDVVAKLRLHDLLSMPTSNLSNGQTRRAKIAKALLLKPELLLLDEPFIGLDPPTLMQLNPILRELAYSSSPRVLLALRPQDPIPNWITHTMYLGQPLTITHQGPKEAISKALAAEVATELKEIHDRRKEEDDETARLEDIPRYNSEFGRTLVDEGIVENPDHLQAKRSRIVRQGLKEYNMGARTSKTMHSLGLHGRIALQDENYHRRQLPEAPPVGEPLIEMDGVVVKYGDTAVLGKWNEQLSLKVKPRRTLNSTMFEPYLEREIQSQKATDKTGLRWTVRRGQRWALIGPNGSGKTTLLSLITSDHPQAYALPIRLFGQSRLPTPGQPGLSLFDIQSRIGHSSPEVHSFFPRNLTVRRTLESAYADTPRGRPSLNYTDDARVDACLRWFRAELNPAAGSDPNLQDEMLRPAKAPKSEWTEATDGRLYRLRRQASVYALEQEEQRGIAWADTMLFGELTFSAQRLALFLRAIVAQPDIVILDEAFSGMDDVMRDKCMLFLSHGETRLQSPYLKNHMFFSQRKLGDRKRRPGAIGRENLVITEGLTKDQALIVISHVVQEIPSEVQDFLYLPDASAKTSGRCVIGQARGVQLARDARLWDAIWNIPSLPIEDVGADAAEAMTSSPYSESEVNDGDRTSEITAKVDKRKNRSLITSYASGFIDDASALQQLDKNTIFYVNRQYIANSNRIRNWGMQLQRLRDSMAGLTKQPAHECRAARKREAVQREKREKAEQSAHNKSERRLKSLTGEISLRDERLKWFVRREKHYRAKMYQLQQKIEELRNAPEDFVEGSTLRDKIVAPYVKSEKKVQGILGRLMLRKECLEKKRDEFVRDKAALKGAT